MASLILLAALFGLSQLLLFIMDYEPSADRVPTTVDRAVLAVQRVLFGEPEESGETETDSDPQTAVVNPTNK